METKISCRQRIAGYDLARGIAILVMVILNFRGIFSCHDSFPVWLSQGMGFMNRRAAVLLVMVAGAGLTLLSGYAVDGQRVRIRPGSCSVLFKRALFLLFAGYLLSMTWSGDILHFYGIYILIGILYLKCSNRSLMVSAAIFWLAGCFQFTDGFDLMLQQGEDSLFSRQMVDILFAGYYPVCPWAALLLAGMWLGRQDAGDPVFRKRGLILGSLLFVFSELISRGVTVMAGDAGHDLPFLNTLSQAACLDLSASTPLGVVSGAGTGLCVIMLSLMAATSPKKRWVYYLSVAGKTSLTLYVFQILFVINSLLFLGVSDRQNILVVLVGSFAFFGLYTGCASLWLDKYAKGPLEILMRKFLVFGRLPGDTVGIMGTGVALNEKSGV